MFKRSAVLVSALSCLVVATDARAQDEGGDEKPKPKAAHAADLARTSESVVKVLDGTKLDLDIDAPLLDALDGQAERLGLVVVVDPGVREVAIKEKLQAASQLKVGSTGRTIFTALLACKQDLTFEVWRGTVFVTSKTKAPPAPPIPELTDAARKLWNNGSVDVEFADAALEDVVEALAKDGGLPLVLGAKAKGKVTLAGKGILVGNAVDLVCRLAGLKVAKAGDKLELRPRSPSDKPGPPEAGVVEAKRRSAAEVKKVNDALERALDEKKVGLDFEDAELAEVLASLEEKSGLDFVVDAAVDQKKKVTASVNELSVRNALDRVLTPFNYVVDVRDGVLVIKPR